MKYFRPVLLAFAVMLALAPADAFGQGSPAGDWDLTIDTPQGANTVSLSLAQDGEKLTGSLSSPIGTVPVTGTSTSDAVALTAQIDVQGNSLQLGVDGKVDGDTLNGTVKFGDFGEFPFTGKRAVKTAAAPAAAAAVPAAPPAGGTATTAAGKWNVVLMIPGAGEFPASATLTQDAGGIVGGVLSSQAGEVAVSGTMTGSALRLEFKATTPQGEIPIVMTGDLSETGFTGKASIAGMGEADWTATRVQ